MGGGSECQSEKPSWRRLGAHCCECPHEGRGRTIGEGRLEELSYLEVALGQCRRRVRERKREDLHLRRLTVFSRNGRSWDSELDSAGSRFRSLGAHPPPFEESEEERECSHESLLP